MFERDTRFARVKSEGVNTNEAVTINPIVALTPIGTYPELNQIRRKFNLRVSRDGEVALMVCDEGIFERKVQDELKDYFKFAPSVAPVQVGIYPLVNKEGPREIAIEITDKLRESGFKVEYDVSGTIGKRYARADEIGIPLAITVDFDSLEDNKVTVRNRDSEAQERIAIDEIKDYLEEYYK